MSTGNEIAKVARGQVDDDGEGAQHPPGAPKPGRTQLRPGMQRWLNPAYMRTAEQA